MERKRNSSGRTAPPQYQFCANVQFSGCFLQSYRHRRRARRCYTSELRNKKKVPLVKQRTAGHDKTNPEKPYDAKCQVA